MIGWRSWWRKGWCITMFLVLRLICRRALGLIWWYWLIDRHWLRYRNKLWWNNRLLNINLLNNCCSTSRLLIPNQGLSNNLGLPSSSNLTADDENNNHKNKDRSNDCRRDFKAWSTAGQTQPRTGTVLYFFAVSIEVTEIFVSASSPEPLVVFDTIALPIQASLVVLMTLPIVRARLTILFFIVTFTIDAESLSVRHSKAVEVWRTFLWFDEKRTVHEKEKDDDDEEPSHVVDCKEFVSESRDTSWTVSDNSTDYEVVMEQ